MDPNFTLQMIDDYLRMDGDREGAREYAGYLKEWIDDGGFEPDWTRYPLAYAYYLHRCHGDPDDTDRSF